MVVFFSIFVQGLTMTPLLRRMGEMPLPHESGASRDVV
jgi:NhaP-type Na+/H+ or K+/H+ antiporter